MNIETVIKLIKSKTSEEIQTKFCGKLIGIGLFRDVYEMVDHPDYVIKVETCPNQKIFANATEWRHWQHNQEWKFLRKWLAPCLFISQDGIILIQRRVEFREKKHYPKKIPAMFTDTKIQNYGWIPSTGKFVACDYSFLVLHTGPRLLKRVRWSDKGHHK